MIRRGDPFGDSSFTEGVALGVLVTLVLMAGLAYLLVRFEDMTPLYRHGHAVGYTAALDSLEELTWPEPESLVYRIPLMSPGRYRWVDAEGWRLESRTDTTVYMDSTLRPHGGW